MKIVISSKWFPVCVAVYLKRAAERAGHTVLTAGPTTGTFTGWAEVEPKKKQHVPCDMAIYPTLETLPDTDQPRFSEHWLRAASWCDLWIDVDGGWFAYAQLPTKRRVLVATDPHCDGPHFAYDKQRDFVDEVYMMQGPYTRSADRWLPYGFDPEWHRRVEVEQAHDVTVLGAPYDERVQIADTLRAQGLRVLGPGRGAIGAEYARMLCSAPLALVWPWKGDLPARVFEALACGVATIAKGVPDLDRLLPHGPVPCNIGPGLYTTSDGVDGFIEGALQYHRWDALKLEATRCRQETGLVTMAHSWDARLQQIIEGRTTP